MSQLAKHTKLILGGEGVENVLDDILDGNGDDDLNTEETEGTEETPAKTVNS